MVDVAVIDYGMGNLRSVQQALRKVAPDAEIVVSDDGPRLSPRKSFAAWREVVRGRSAPWAPAELAAAEMMRVTMLEVVLQHAGLSELEARAASQKQELLIAELNHRSK